MSVFRSSEKPITDRHNSENRQQRTDNRTFMIRIGDTLKEERERQGYSVEDVALATKIRSTFLRALEEGRYKSLPSSTYAHGFVKNYIDFLGLPQKKFLAIFRREFDEQEHRKVLPDNISTQKEISVNRLRIRQATILGVAVAIGLFVYVFLQYRQAFFNPSISISTPQEHMILSSQTILVKGTTDPNTTVTVNNIPVLVDPDGHFQKLLAVFAGDTTITIVSTNTFGKQSTVLRHITVR